MRAASENELKLKSSVVSIGAFDGVHRGHQALIRQMVNRARELGVPSVVYTFDPPPRAYFQGHRVLTSVEEKLELMKKLNVDYTIAARFNKHYALRPPEEFIKELRSLGTKEVWAGRDFRFGKGQEGTIEMLSGYFTVNIFPFVTCEQGEKISSTRVRELLKQKDWIKINHLLGRTSVDTFMSK
ncbi:FAD synthetase [Siminovitchia sediminis]|uniref:FAD synthase n=1 Tax=Siminovitchia sediminis TaxID=1274353 RepID=A0ABW4KLZ8_9BACI